MLISYYRQITDVALTKGVDILKACEKSGVSDSTYYRWREGKTSPQLRTAERIIAAINDLAA